MTTLLRFLVASVVWATAAAYAAPVTPTRDDEVVEVLPQASGDRSEERKLRREWQADPANAPKAIALARRYLDHARGQGDPRYAGQALAVLQAWPDEANAPDEVLLMQATLQQYLHDFDGAAKKLEALTARRPQDAQAWLTLATIRRVQGRYEPSDRACAALAGLGSGATLYARACRAENDSLRGKVDEARSALAQLLAAPRLPDGTRNWLLTTLAEAEERAGRAAEAEAAFRAALKAAADAYTTMAFSDFLLDRGRPAEALALLKSQPRTDAVLLRLAIAGTRAKSADAAADVREVRERTAQANLRPDARTTHAREAAMLAMWVDDKPAEALAFARANIAHQREPLDLLVLAHAARAAKDADARRDAARIKAEMGLHDRRLDALL